MREVYPSNVQECIDGDKDPSRTPCYSEVGAEQFQGKDRRGVNGAAMHCLQKSEQSGSLSRSKGSFLDSISGTELCYGWQNDKGT